jgi:cytochrome c oxidase cbb3-type subunit 3
MEPPSILVGNAADGKAYFQKTCTGCHSVDGDLKGIASRITDPKAMQVTWLVGAFRSGRGPAPKTPRNTVTAAVTLTNGQKVEGKLVRIDDFNVTVETADGTQRTIRRDGDVPKVVVNDPLAAHREMYPKYSDKNVHDVTAYLVTVK